MSNVKQIISSHNKNVLKKTEPKTTVTKTCNCRARAVEITENAR